jgi:hypothetical protein
MALLTTHYSLLTTYYLLGAHHQDLRFASELDSVDVKQARQLEEAAVRQWLAEV